MPRPSELLSRSALAKLRGCTPKAISDLVHRGMPVAKRDKHGRVAGFSGPEVLAWLEDQGKQDSKVRDFTRERARHEAAKAELAEIELAQKRGEMLPAADAEAAVVALLSGVRQRLLSVPTKAAPLAYSAESVQEAESVIRERLYEALEAIAEVSVDVAATGASSDRGNRPGRRVGDEAAAEPDDKRVGRPRATAKRGVKCRARKVVDKSS